MEQDVVIVGGGIAGLAAAALAARGGARPLVLERASHLGGRAETRERSGYCFNLGAHALYTGGAASRVLEELGVRFPGGSPKGLLTLHDGRFSALPATPASLFRTDLLDLGDKLELVRFFAKLGRLDPRATAGLSVQAWLDANVRRPNVRRLIEGVARTSIYSAALDLASAEPFLTRLQLSAKYPIRYVDGGWRTIVEGLRSVAEAAGARVETGARVEKIEPTDGGWLVRASSPLPLGEGQGEGVLRARAVVIATTPHAATELLGDTAPNVVRDLQDAMPARVACLDVALRRLPRPDRPVVQDLDAPRFLTAQSQFTKIAPAGGALIHTFKQLDPRAPADPRRDEADLEALLDASQPGWRDELVERVFLPHMEASGILPTASAGGFAGRPRVEVADGLYLAGDWVGPEGYQTDAALASAEAAARAVLAAPAERRRAA